MEKQEIQNKIKTLKASIKQAEATDNQSALNYLRPALSKYEIMLEEIEGNSKKKDEPKKEPEQKKQQAPKATKTAKNDNCDDEVKKLKNQVRDLMQKNENLEDKLSKNLNKKTTTTTTNKNKSSASNKTSKNKGLPAPNKMKLLPSADSEIKKTGKKPKSGSKTRNKGGSGNQNPKPKKTANKAPKTEAKGVFKIDEQVRLIKRFVSFFNSKKEKTEASLISLLSAIKRALLEKRITQSSTYSSQIMYMQEQIVKALNKTGGSKYVLEVPQDKMDTLKDIAASEKVLLSVTYIKQFYTIIKNKNDDKAKKLAARIGKAMEQGAIKSNDPYFTEIKKAFGKLNAKNYTLTASELAGINYALGCACDTPKKKSSLGDVPTADFDMPSKLKTQKGMPEELSAGDMMKMKIDEIGFRGEWLELMGNPATPFHVVVWGQPKHGKSILNVMFADYLQSNFGNVLYLSTEEFGGSTLTKKIQEIKPNPNIVFRNSLPSSQEMKKFKFLIIDSVTKAKMSHEDMESIKIAYPHLSTIAILQVTKDGNFKGGQEWTHNSDINIEVLDGVAKAAGRYGGGEMDIFYYLNARINRLKRA